MNAHFNSIREAISYIREMTVEQTEEIGCSEVWRHESGAIFIGTAEELLSTDEQSDEWKLIGTVQSALI